MRFVRPTRANSLSLKVLLAYLIGVVLSIGLIAPCVTRIVKAGRP
jgi:hypothetical protein